MKPACESTGIKITSGRPREIRPLLQQEHYGIMSDDEMREWGCEVNADRRGRSDDGGYADLHDSCKRRNPVRATDFIGSTAIAAERRFAIFM